MEGATAVPCQGQFICFHGRVPISVQPPPSPTIQGRRSLLNLGQTCFLNVVLQSFLHNPLLRNYFLSDKHNSKLCLKPKDCTCCEMDKLFAEVSFVVCGYFP